MEKAAFVFWLKASEKLNINAFLVTVVTTAAVREQAKFY